MKSKIFAVATFAFAFAFALSASAISASAIYSPSTGYLKTGSGMGAKAYQMPNVIAAQTALNACVPGTMLVLDGKMGPLTTAKFQAFQAAQVPAIQIDGIIGPVTAASLAACSGNQPSPSTPSTPSDLSGTDGTINDVNNLSQYNNEEVGEGENDVKVSGFEVEASTDGDIQLISAKVVLDPSGNTGSKHLDQYVDKVTVWMGSTEVGSADASDFSKQSDDSYSKTISLSNVVVKADDTEKFYISFDAVSGFDSADISGDSWTVDVDNLRYKDGSGVVTTEDTQGDLPLSTSVDFVSFSTSADTELKVTLDSSSPEAGIVTIDDTDNTDGVVLLKGKLQLKGTSDALIDSFPVTLVSTSDSISATTGSLTLTIDGEEYTESTGSNCVTSCDSNTTATLVFDNLNFNMNAGDTVNFSISADINDINNSGVTATDLDEGDTILAKVTSDNRDVMDVENEQGDQLSDSSEKSGTATGKAQELRTSAATFTLVSTNTSVGTATSNNTGTFTIRFKVAAGDDPVYISSVIGNAVTYAVDRSGTATTGGVSAAFVNITDSSVDNAVGLNEINPGTPETFELTVTASVPTSGAAGLYRAAISAIAWGTDATDNTPNNSYTSDIDSFRTSYQSIN